MSFDFTGKVILISGSSAGIGAVTAIRFATVGAQVVIVGSNAENVAEIGLKCNDVSPKGLTALQVVADLTREDECKRLVQTTVDTFNKIDILVTNADVIWNHTINDSEYIEKYKHIMQTNLDSVVYLTHFCWKYLSKTKGNIVNNSSISGIVSANCQTPQCITKSALDIFNKYMAAELAPRGIRLNSINPGAIRNNAYKYSCLNKHDSDTLFNSYLFMRNSGNGSRQVEHIANAILYLASDHASFITGFNYVDDCFCSNCFSLEIRSFFSFIKQKLY